MVVLRIYTLTLSSVTICHTELYIINKIIVKFDAQPLRSQLEEILSLISIT